MNDRIEYCFKCGSQLDTHRLCPNCDYGDQPFIGQDENDLVFDEDMGEW